MEVAIIPEWLFKLLSLDERKKYEANVLISNLLIIIAFAIFGSRLLILANELPHFCLFNKIIGIPCPVCGITRAFCELSKGNITQAYYLNLSSLFVASFFVFQIPLRICSLYKPETQKIVTKISKTLGRLVLVIIVANWLINIIIISVLNIYDF